VREGKASLYLLRSKTISERPKLAQSGSNPLNFIMYPTVMSDQRSLKKYFSALILCPVIMIFSYIQENDPFGRFYPLDYF